MPCAAPTNMIEFPLAQPKEDTVAVTDLEAGKSDKLQAVIADQSKNGNVSAEQSDQQDRAPFGTIKSGHGSRDCPHFSFSFLRWLSISLRTSMLLIED